MFKSIEQYRVTIGKNATNNLSGNNGLFHIPLHDKKRGIIRNKLFGDLYGWAQVVTADKRGWELCAVSIISPNKKHGTDRYPTWEEMKIVKDFFWDKEDITVNFYFDETILKNKIPNLLYMCRKIGSIYEMPIGKV